MGVPLTFIKVVFKKIMRWAVPWIHHYGKSCVQWLMDPNYVANAHWVLAQAITYLHYFSQVFKMYYMFIYYIYTYIYMYI